MAFKSNRKPIVLISPLLKFGGEVALHLLTCTDSDIVLMFPSCKDIETLRSQLPEHMRKRLIPREFNLYSGSSIRMAMLWLKLQFDRIDEVIHLKPQIESHSESFIKNRFNSVLYSNDRSVEIVKNDLKNYFGNKTIYVEYDFELGENPMQIAYKAVCG